VFYNTCDLEEYCLLGEVMGHHIPFSIYHCGCELIIKENLSSLLLRLKQVTADMVVITSGKSPSK
jgi:hypothetical protein